MNVWISLYAGVSVCAGICAILAMLYTAWEIKTGAWRPPLETRSQLLVALPRIWLHWQLRYLSGFPVTMLIAVLYAYHLGFTVLAKV